MDSRKLKCTGRTRREIDHGRPIRQIHAYQQEIGLMMTVTLIIAVLAYLAQELTKSTYGLTIGQNLNFWAEDHGGDDLKRNLVANWPSVEKPRKLSRRTPHAWVKEIFRWPCGSSPTKTRIVCRVI
jgi:hypothetical protein